MYSLYPFHAFFFFFFFNDTATTEIYTLSLHDALPIYVCTNLPYRSVASSGTFAVADFRPLTFPCRRRNWDATCTLMVATRPLNTHRYLAFGGGDLVPMRLDDEFTVDTRLPSHMHNLANSFAVCQYLAVQTINVANVPYVIAAGNQNNTPVFSSFAI